MVNGAYLKNKSLRFLLKTAILINGLGYCECNYSRIDDLALLLGF